MTPTIGEIDGLPALVVLEGGWRDEYAQRDRGARRWPCSRSRSAATTCRSWRACRTCAGWCSTRARCATCRAVAGAARAGDADAQHGLQAADGARLRARSRRCGRCGCTGTRASSRSSPRTSLESLFVFGPPDARPRAASARCRACAGWSSPRAASCCQPRVSARASSSSASTSRAALSELADLPPRLTVLAIEGVEEARRRCVAVPALDAAEVRQLRGHRVAGAAARADRARGVPRLGVDPRARRRPVRAARAAAAARWSGCATAASTARGSPRSRRRFARDMMGRRGRRAPLRPSLLARADPAQPPAARHPARRGGRLRRRHVLRPLRAVERAPGRVRVRLVLPRRRAGARPRCRSASSTRPGSATTRRSSPRRRRR